MRVLLFHGYLLRGTGSNVYNAELAQAMARRGDEVHLFCQDREAAGLPWVDAVGEWRDGALRVTETAASRERQPGRGRITAYVPEIGGLLPVFVHDRYEGFEVKTYPELTEAELERYLAANVEAVAEVAGRVGGFDAALANHLVMGPVILARAGIRFAAKIHGSDLSYTVRPHPERFVPFAREGMAAASAALVGSLHTARDLWQVVDLPGLVEKTRLGPPGLDPEEFRPRERQAATLDLRELAGELAAIAAVDGDGAFGRTPARAATALEWYAEAPAERLVYVGKLLYNKGVDLLLCAWPLVVGASPRARLLLAGFGAFGPTLEALWQAISAGDLEAARALAERSSEDGAPRRMRLAGEFLAAPPEGYRELARAAAGSVRVTGRLEHGEVARVLPAATALVMPSTFPEAFGMVAAEAAASGLLPLSAGHSGMVEVSARLGEVLDPQVAPLLSFGLDDRPVLEIAEKLSAWLAIDPSERARIGSVLRGRAAALWSWEGVASGIVGASNGDLMRLSTPGDIVESLQ